MVLNEQTAIISAQGYTGITQSISVRKGDDSGACDIMIVSGLIVSTTCDEPS